MSIILKFHDDGNENELSVSSSDKLIDVFQKYVSEQGGDPRVVTDRNIVIFFKGKKQLNKSDNISQSVQDIGLDQDSVIKVDWKGSRHYALNET